MDNLFFNIHSLYEFQYLKVGTHEYFGQSIETTPIRTQLALCYKMESKTKFDHDTAFFFSVHDEKRKPSNDTIDKLESINLYVADNNTWQGVIYGAWPTKNPLRITGKIGRDSLNSYFMPIEVTERSHLKGNGKYSQCIDENEYIGLSCKSIFHPNSYKYENKFVF